MGSVERSVAGYSKRADEYARQLGSLSATCLADRRLIASWGLNVRGDIIDIGCGPGHWTAYLSRMGCKARGIDPVPVSLR